MVGWGLQSNFHVQPNHCVEFVLRCVVVGVVTILLLSVFIFFVVVINAVVVDPETYL